MSELILPEWITRLNSQKALPDEMGRLVAPPELPRREPEWRQGYDMGTIPYGTKEESTPALLHQAIGDVGNYFANGVTGPIKRTMGPLYGEMEGTSDDVLNAAMMGMGAGWKGSVPKLKPGEISLGEIGGTKGMGKMEGRIPDGTSPKAEGGAKPFDKSEVQKKVYHWTSEENPFQSKKGSVWFSEEKEVHASKDKHLVEAYIDIRNPLIIPGVGEIGQSRTFSEWMQEFRNLGIDTNKLQFHKYVTEKEDPLFFGELLEYKNNFRKVVSDLGYDGVVAPSSNWSTDHAEYIVFNHDQIKEIATTKKTSAGTPEKLGFKNWVESKGFNYYRLTTEANKKTDEYKKLAAEWRGYYLKESPNPTRPPESRLSIPDELPRRTK